VTEAAAVECPVCGEGFREAPARCFRCETDLSHWWPLDESLRVLGAVVAAAAVAPPAVVVPEVADVAVAPEAGPATSGRRAWALPVVLLAGLGGALLLHLESSRPPVEAPRSVTPLKAEPEPVAPPPVSSANASPAPRVPPRTVRYVVQPGDSLWRIAAALKGDARRWPELLAGGTGVDPARLRPGQELRLVVDGNAVTRDDGHVE
jgi:nucleoid-associated protein YgaU